jgi:fermentation-respiration switch protein FrsA (DUF1100 family)
MVKSALVLLGVVMAVALLVRLVESRFAFFPLAGETVTPRQFGVNYEALSIETADGERLRAWLLQPASGPAEAGHDGESPNGPGQALPRANVLYFHGNGGNLSVWAPILTDVARHGYSVLAFDYRGYGDSTGRPTERGLYRDVDAVLAWFWGSSPSTRPIIYWGRSLGGAMAAYAATVRPPDGIILESAFPDVRSLFGSGPLTLFASYRFPTAAFMERAGTRALVLHGDSDRIIPYEQGRSLFERIPEPKSLVTIRGGDHNDATPRDPTAYWDAVNGFSAGL